MRVTEGKKQSTNKEVSILEIFKRDRSIPETNFYRTLSEKECAKRLRVLQPGEFDDVILRPSRRRECGNVGNVPYRLKNAWWYEWGYVGDGPRDAAINILFHFSGNVSFAREWTFEFVDEVMTQLPPRVPVAISARFIIGWINARKGKTSGYSYDFPYLCPEDYAWEFGGWEATPRPLYVE